MTLSSTSELRSLLAQMLNGPHRSTNAAAIGAGTLSSPPASAPPGRLTETVLQALRQIGVNGSPSSSAAGSSSSSGTSSKQSASALALQSFIQSLLAALQPQNGSGLPLSGHVHHAVRSSGHIEQRLKTLISQLQSPAGSTPGQGSSPSNTLTSLESSFNRLMSAFGSSATNSASLGAFLNTLATDLAANAPTGTLVSTQA